MRVIIISDERDRATWLMGELGEEHRLVAQVESVRDVPTVEPDVGFVLHHSSATGLRLLVTGVRRRFGPDHPILVTGRADAVRELEHALDAGADDFIVWPQGLDFLNTRLQMLESARAARAASAAAAAAATDAAMKAAAEHAATMAAAETPSAPPAAPAHPPWAATATEPEAAVARLAGGVAEGFDRVLGSVFAHLDRAAAALPARRKNVRDELEQARAALERAASLTRMLLAYGRRLTIDPEYVSINDVVAEAIPRLERRLRGRGTLKFEPGVHTGIVLADPIQLEQIVLTLCQRAVMTAASGATEVTVLSSLIPGRLVEPDPSRTRALEGRFARLRVVDNGSGIPPRHLPHIFDPFARTDRGRWGTGLELPMLQGIVAQHEGFVTAANREGGGAVFTIYLPAVDRAPARITRTPAEEAGGAERILLVEDDELVRTLAERVLADAGYIVESAADGQEAVDRVRDQGNTFDLAILDMIMPRMGGRAAYEELSAMAPELRFLFVSGYTMSADDAEFLSHHGRSFLPKPFNRGQLLREIRTLLDA